MRIVDSNACIELDARIFVFRLEKNLVIVVIGSGVTEEVTTIKPCQYNRGNRNGHQRKSPSQPYRGIRFTWTSYNSTIHGVDVDKSGCTI